MGEIKYINQKTIFKCSDGRIIKKYIMIGTKECRGRNLCDNSKCEGIEYVTTEGNLCSHPNGYYLVVE